MTIARNHTAMKMAEVMENKLAEDVTVFDLRHLPYVTDYFVVATGSSSPHVRAIADAVEEAYPSPLHREIDTKEEWLLLDYGDVVVHIFQPSARAYYALERLWGDVPTKSVEPTRQKRQERPRRQNRLKPKNNKKKSRAPQRARKK